MTPGVQHQVAHRPARQPEQAQQPVLHLRPLGEQGQVAFAPQQRLDPVDEQHRRGRRAARFRRPPAPRARSGGRGATLLSSRSSLILGCAQSGRTRAASSAGSWARNSSAVDRQRRRAAGAAAVLRRRAAVVQELVELDARRTRARCRAGRGTAPCRPRRRGRGWSRSSRGRRRRSAGRASAGRRGTGCGARRGAAACRRRSGARPRRASSGRRRRACRSPSASSGCGSRGTGRRGRRAAAGR